MNILTPGQLHILQHSIGVDKFGQGRAYRNHYVIGADCDGFEDCKVLVALGMMDEHPPRELTGMMYCFTVTQAGRQAVKDQSPKPPKLTRSQQRYRNYVQADCNMSFHEWLRLPKEMTT